jgi:hypothetical protein
MVRSGGDILNVACSAEHQPGPDRHGFPVRGVGVNDIGCGGGGQPNQNLLK